MMKPALEQLANRISAANEFGALHIFISDGNVEDDDLAFCMSLSECTAEERSLCMDALLFTEDERFQAWEMSLGRL